MLWWRDTRRQRARRPVSPLCRRPQSSCWSRPTGICSEYWEDPLGPRSRVSFPSEGSEGWPRTAGPAFVCSA
eukprot:13493127-Heterocapsa_arctica.AAC.1